MEPIEYLPRAQGRGLGAEEKLNATAGKRRKPGDEPPKVRTPHSPMSIWVPLYTYDKRKCELSIAERNS